MTLAAAKTKIAKVFKTQSLANTLGVTSNYNIPLITFNNAKAKLNYEDGVKLSNYYNILLTKYKIS